MNCCSSVSTSVPMQVGVLIPLDKNLEEDGSALKIALNEGANFVGRDSVLVSDKRLSRKHIVLNTNPDGSLDIVVESSNPIVVRCLDQRKKVLSKERIKINGGDIIELIPGHHFLKYVNLLNETKSSPLSKQKRKIDEVIEVDIDHGRAAKGKWINSSQGEAMAKNLQENIDSPPSMEAIRDFRVDHGKLPLIFRLLKVQGLPAWANTSCVSITDVIQGDILMAFLSNYMVDMDWLLSACPILKKVPHVMVIHGEGDGTLDYMKMKKPANWILHKPPLPISYGTHHSKAMLLVYAKGIRVIVHTANLIHIDWNNKSQGLWMQDFPWKEERSSSNMASGFETDLVEYFSALKLPEFTSKLPGLDNCRINSLFFKKFDYSDAVVRLIGSVPGYHNGSNLRKWGHMKMRTVLQDCVFDKEFRNSPLIYQFSSLGSLDEKWMSEFATSMSSGVTEDKKALGLGESLIIWPTVEDVRCSIEGYGAGGAIPSPLKNVEKEFLKKYWAKWSATHTGRCRAMPHIKTFTRYNGQELAWFLLTSSNLSKAAWGALQKNNSQLMIRSYELGVLFLPTMIKQHRHRFSCTEQPERVQSPETDSNVKKTKLVTLAWKGNKNMESSHEVIRLPVPYELPPKRYLARDIPWSWDRRYQVKDVYGQCWPR